MRLVLLITCGMWLLLLPGASIAIWPKQVWVLNEWKNLEFGFDSLEQKQYALDNGLYIPTGQKRLYDSDVQFSLLGIKRQFISLPRITPGIPFTVGYVDDNVKTSNGPVIRAYPNINWHLNRTCDGILSVFRIYLEQKCHRLWIIDSGRDFTLAPNLTQKCPPKIMAFNVNNDKLLFVYEVPNSQYTAELSAFNFINVLTRDDCRKSIAYVTDPRGPGLVVFSLEKFTSWRTTSALYALDPNLVTATIAGETMTLMDGLYTISPSVATNTIFFHPFASKSEMSVPLSLINDQSQWPGNHETSFNVIGERPTQSPGEALDSRGNLWFTLFDPLAIVCWDPATEYRYENFHIVVIDNVNLQFVSGFKIRRHLIWGEILYLTSNRYQASILETQCWHYQSQ